MNRRIRGRSHRRLLQRMALPDARHAEGPVMLRRLKQAALLLAAGWMLCACTAELKPAGPMESFSFAHSGMSTADIYTLSAALEADGWTAGAQLLCGAEEHSLKMNPEDAAALNALVETHRLTQWNGFDKADRRVLDGTAFELTIGYADGQTLRASGSNAFPKGYSAAHDEIRRFFGELMEKNGLNNPFE